MHGAFSKPIVAPGEGFNSNLMAETLSLGKGVSVGELDRNQSVVSDRSAGSKSSYSTDFGELLKRDKNFRKAHEASDFWAGKTEENPKHDRFSKQKDFLYGS